MKFNATLYIQNTVEAAAFYMEAFGLTLGYHEKFPDGTYMHASLMKDGTEIFAVSESRNDAFVRLMLQSSIKESRPTMNLCLSFANAEEVSKAYNMLSKEGTVTLPIGSLPWSDCCAEVVDKYGVYWYIST